MIKAVGPLALKQDSLPVGECRYVATGLGLEMRFPAIGHRSVSGVMLEAPATPEQFPCFRTSLARDIREFCERHEQVLSRPNGYLRYIKLSVNVYRLSICFRYDDELEARKVREGWIHKEVYLWSAEERVNRTPRVI